MLKRKLIALLNYLDPNAYKAASTFDFPWMNIRIPPSKRAQMLLEAMNKTEKLILLQGAKGYGIGALSIIA